MLSYIVVPCIAIVTLVIGRQFTWSGMGWYQSSVSLPVFTPPKWVFGVVWKMLYILVVISVLRVWNNFPQNNTFYIIIGLFCLNLVLNLLWSYLFFAQQAIGWAAIEAIVQCIAMATLIVLLGKQDKVAAVLLVPYLVWIIFASYLNYSIWVIN